MSTCNNSSKARQIEAFKAELQDEPAYVPGALPTKLPRQLNRLGPNRGTCISMQEHMSRPKGGKGVSTYPMSHGMVYAGL